MTDELTTEETSTPEGGATPESNLKSILNQYLEINEKRSRLERELDLIAQTRKAISETIVSLMVELEYQSVNYNGIKYWLSVPGRVSINPERRTDFIAWLEGNGEDGIIQRDYINVNTLWGWYNQRENETKEELQGMLKVSEDILLNSPRDYVRKRKKK